MLETGILENVGAIFGLHVSAQVPIGSVASRSGPLLAACGFFDAVISGKGGHAALPHHSIDPILAAANIVVSLQQLVSREADPLDSQVTLFFSLKLAFHDFSMEFAVWNARFPMDTILIFSTIWDFKMINRF